MRTVTRLTHLAIVAATGISLAACGSGSTAGRSTASSSTPAAGRSATGSASAAAPGSASSSASPATSAGSGAAVTLIRQSRSATTHATSAHLFGTAVSGGVTQKIDMSGALDGSNQQVTIDEGSKGAATVRIVAKDKNYIKGNLAYWTTTGAPAATAKRLADKWVIAPAKVTSGLSGLSIDSFLQEVIGPQTLTDADLKQARATRTTRDGKDVWVISDAGKSAGQGAITLDAGTKYVVGISVDSTTDGTINFTMDGWNTQPKVTAPSHPVDSAALGK